MPQPRLEGSYRLARGGRLGFAEYGRPDGRVVFWFHGTPGGRRQIAPAARVAAQEMGVRLIVLERPGIGFSTPHRYTALSEWADDVLDIADRLGIDRFACAGLSGGGPYVLACAARAPGRMVAGAVLGGVAPSRGPDAIGGGLVGVARRVAPMFELTRGVLGHVLHLAFRSLWVLREPAFDMYIAISPPGDQRVFRRPEMRAMFLDDLDRVTARQMHAPALDVLLFTRDWGFSVRDIAVPIRFWHGDSDNIVPLAHGRHVASLVPDATLTVRPGESHLGSLDAAEEIFAALLEHWPEAPPGEATAG